MKSIDLARAIGDAKDADLLSAHDAAEHSGHSKKAIRILLVAAALTAFLTMTAAAVTLWTRFQRMAPMPETPSGETRAAMIHNGFRGTPTYQGTAEWFAYMAQWTDTHGLTVPNYDLEFTKGDLDYYKTCNLYHIFDQEQANKLYEISDKYDLILYQDLITVDDMDNGENFFKLSGCKPFTEDLADERFCGYVFEDGSFKLEEGFLIEGETIRTDIHKIHSGVLYPFGGADDDDTIHREEAYVTARGQAVMLDFPQNSPYPFPAYIYYVSDDGEIFIEVSIFDLYSSEETNYVRLAKALADSIDFTAMEPSDGTAHELLNYRTAAEDNPELVQRLEKIRSSYAMQIPSVFEKYYLESPEYDIQTLRYFGVYDTEKYPDLAEKLRELSEAYDLTYATETTLGNAFFDNAVVYDNGAWRAEFPFDRFDSMATLHYIPRTALYTGWEGLAEISEYREVWEYTAADGTELLCFSSGPEFGQGAAGHGMILETQDGWLILEAWGIPHIMMKAADMVDWAGIVKQ